MNTYNYYLLNYFIHTPLLKMSGNSSERDRWEMENYNKEETSIFYKTKDAIVANVKKYKLHLNVIITSCILYPPMIF